MNDPQGIAADLVRMQDVTEVQQEAAARLGAGDAAWVADLGIAVWQRYGRQPAPPWQYRSVAGHLLRLLTLTPGAVEQALRLISATADRRGARQAASLLASAHSTADLTRVFSAGATEELRACLLQEMILRGAQVDHEWTASPHWRHHPLAWLPRDRTPLEGRPPLPQHTVTGGGHDLPTVPARPVTTGGPAPTATETTTPAAAKALSAAVANWAEESNGSIEARTFDLDTDLLPGALARTLQPLTSFAGYRSGLGTCSATDAWQQLFTAAAFGGAYNSGAHGAYGRLFAWQSVAALTGAADAPAAEVEARAQASSWYSFAETTRWFNRIAWDIGLAVVAPDRRHLAVLAATDTD
jgi:hypothetical protein